MDHNADYAVIRIPKALREKYRKISAREKYKPSWQSIATSVLEVEGDKLLQESDNV